MIVWSGIRRPWCTVRVLIAAVGAICILAVTLSAVGGHQ